MDRNSSFKDIVPETGLDWSFKKRVSIRKVLAKNTRDFYNIFPHDNEIFVAWLEMRLCPLEVTLVQPLLG